MKTGWLALAMSLLVETATAISVAGTEVPDTHVNAAGQVLLLNGAGVRSKFFFDIYVGALYLPAAAHTPAEVLNQSGGRRVSMHILYGEVSAEKLRDGWRDGFRNNHTAAEMRALQARLERFNQLFVRVRKGDVIELDFSAEDGTTVRIAGQARGSVPGRDFNDALMKVWLGDTPADLGLKRAMLGDG